MDEQLVMGCVKAILEKYADPIIAGVGRKAKDEWEKFKVDFDIVFIKYLKNSYNKYSKVKTILFKSEPQFIYDFFEVPYLRKGNNEIIKAYNTNSVLDISHYVIIQGTGGIGKSTLMKHLFIDEIKNKDLIPVYLELKDINDISDKFNISELILEKLNNLGSSLCEEYFKYALKSGCFLFLLDGYDEILTDKRSSFFKVLDTFIDSYPQNYYVISSRPFSEFIELQRFTVLSTCPFNKEQTLSLINKISYDKDIKNRFISALDRELYEKHESFASNPLLLSIMLLTFENYTEIPSKLHLFYANAFETLFEKHDATKAGYRREMRSALPYDSFRKVFSYFCFITYVQGKIEFSRDELIDTFIKISIPGIEYEIDNYVYDLVNSLCVLYKDGINYKFTHRSFQEYFSAFFLKELSDENMSYMGLSIIRKDAFRASHDSVFTMLKDMTEDRFENNILLPLIEEFEEGAVEDKYIFYFKKIVSRIDFSRQQDENELTLVMYLSNDHIGSFLYRCAMPYKNTHATDKVQKEAEKSLVTYLEERGQTEEYGLDVDCETILNNPVLNSLVGKTWIGVSIQNLATLKNRLKQKQHELTIDLSNLLG